VATLEYIDTGHLGFVPLVRTELSGTIAGPLADLSIEHIFRFTAEQCGHEIDALYRFPPPCGAVMRHMTVRFGDVKVETELRPQEAEIVEAVREKDHQGFPVTECSQDGFTLQVSGVPPNEDVHITASYVQVGEPHGIGFSFRIPSAGRSMSGNQDSSKSPTVSFHDPNSRFIMQVRSAGKGELSSPTFGLQRDGHMYSLKAGIVPDRDLELIWTPDQFEDRPMLQVFTDGTSNPCFLALVSPSKACGEGLPREWTIMLDRSPSMEGVRRQATDRAAERLLSSLLPRDRFNLCLFNSTAAWLSDRPLRATADNVAKAISLLQGGEPGGPGLEAALEQALSQQVAGGNISRHVLIITGADISNNARVLEMMRRESLKPARRRCSVLCVDSDSSSHLVQNLAEVGEHSLNLLKPPKGEMDAVAAVDKVLEEWSLLVIADIGLLTSRRLDGLQSVYVNGMYNCGVGELRAGRSTWFAGKCGGGRNPPFFALDGSDDSSEVTVFNGVRTLHDIRSINDL
jgi:Ca-activated chloride channel family protein